MKVGVIVSPAAGWRYDELAALARAWTLVAALARDTERIRLGTLVTAVQYRNPALLAKIAAGIDQISGGRLELGLGAGWKEDEYRAYGYEFPPAGARVEQLRDALEITTRLWRDDRATYAGKHYGVADAVCSPKPLQRPRPPIWVGGARPRVMRLAARYADGFDLGRRGADGRELTAEEMAAAFAELDRAERNAKRERRLMRSHWSPSALEENGSALVEKIRGYARTGLDRYLCAFPKDRAAEMIDRARDRLLPAFA